MINGSFVKKVWEKNSLVLETMQEQLEEKTRHAVNKKYTLI